MVMVLKIFMTYTHSSWSSLFKRRFWTKIEIFWASNILCFSYSIETGLCNNFWILTRFCTLLWILSHSVNYFVFLFRMRSTKLIQFLFFLFLLNFCDSSQKLYLIKLISLLGPIYLCSGQVLCSNAYYIKWYQIYIQ